MLEAAGACLIYTIVTMLTLTFVKEIIDQLDWWWHNPPFRKY